MGGDMLRIPESEHSQEMNVIIAKEISLSETRKKG